MKKEITIPKGFDAKIEDDKIVFVPKESEDEKIRKEILSFLKDGSPYYCPGSITRQKWVAYFEKQKEQKVDIDKLRKDAYKSGYNDGYRQGKEYVRKNAQFVNNLF